MGERLFAFYIQTNPMSRNGCIFLCLCIFPCLLHAQFFKVTGKITNSKSEPLPFASINVKELQYGTISKENGGFELKLEAGKYDIAVTMIGYKSILITVVVSRDMNQNFILDPDYSKDLSEVIIKGKLKDRSEEIIRNVIRHKDDLQSAAGPYSCQVYVRAMQKDSFGVKKKKQKIDTSILALEAAEMSKLGMAEISLKYDKGSSGQIKEERLGVSKHGNPESLFYLSATEGDFSLYNNLLNIRSIAAIPFISPISYSGLIAYRYRTIRITQENGRKVYVIGFKPRQVSNATMEGQLTITDSSWVIVKSSFNLPAYHLPEYDFFNVEQEYEKVSDTAWMITQQHFTYSSKEGKGKRSGETTVAYHDFELHKKFPPKYFGNELSATNEEAYKRDSLFWEKSRIGPLTTEQVKFVRYKDSVYNATHTKAYLDSIDRLINKVTWKKVFVLGQTLHDHEKETTWDLPSAFSVFQPLTFGGVRIMPMVSYQRTFPSRKNISINANLSYGLRNKDLNGSVRLTRMYNPFNRGFYRISGGKEFENIYSGDAWINLIKRSNVYLNKSIGIGHGLELFNGMFLYNDFDIAFRRSVSNYKVGTLVDSLFGDVLENNDPTPFDSYNAVYGKIRLQYTPGQKYLREPKEKIILGSKWPTFYTLWRKGIPGIFKSKADFDYLEFGIEQQVKLGTTGISSYTMKTGSFFNKKDLRLVDYQFQRRGDPLLLLNPNEAFQALDSSFPVFKRFYQLHYLHEFNGFFINKIPFLKKLKLREVAGAGFLIAPERNLRYGEVFAGIERAFRWPFNPLGRFKLGVYVVGSGSNQFRNPVQIKIGITTWDWFKNKWY